MSQRIIRDWTDSPTMNNLSSNAEVLFTRLIMKADDFGNFHAEPKLIRPMLFPLKIDSIREADITRWMDELHKAGLIVFYESDFKKYLSIINFGQRMRNMRNRFPIPPDNSRRVAASCGKLPPEEKRREIEKEIEGERGLQQQSGLSPFLPFKPKAADLNELPDQFIKSTQEYLFRTNNSLIPDEQVIGLWNAWKLQNLHGDKTYNNETEVFKHFVNAHKTLRIQPKNKIHVSATTSELPTIDKEAAKRKYGG